MPRTVEFNARDKAIQEALADYLGSYASGPGKDYDDALGVVFASAATFAIEHYKRRNGATHAQARQHVDTVYHTQGAFLDAFATPPKPDSN